MSFPLTAPTRTLPTRRQALRAAVIVAAAAALAAAALLLGGSAGGRSEATAASAADSFFSRYVEPDGRVVRTDQGGDTVSEGQAYAMLLAAADDDAARFASVWEWTRQNLRLPTGLLAWHWEGGRVVESHSAADADLDAAWALLIAARRFGAGHRYGAEGLALGHAILEHETVSLDGRSLLVAGNWANTFPAIVDPSYFSPAAFAALGRASGGARWGQLESTSYQVLDQLSRRPTGLVPDWARVEPDGEAVPIAPPAQSGEPIFGYDAVRVPLWQWASCNRADQGLAAREAPFLDEAMARSPASRYTLGGGARGAPAGAPMLVAAASASAAAGRTKASTELLNRAAAADEAEPTYYGGALVALARAALEPEGGLAC
ncbi:MAG: glycoside hydrolase [Actinobacteria bacterium]|nr:glycoside hydrolase [Actinomycetota bacterium]